MELGPLSACGPAAWEESTSQAFERWAIERGREYSSEAERSARRANFKANLEIMEQVALQNPLATFAPDDFADWSEEEAQGLRGGAGPPPLSAVATAVSLSAEEIASAAEIDWVARGVVTTPTSQGRCSTCAFFAGVAAVEGAWALAGHELVKLSEQEMIDCGNNGEYALNSIRQLGVARAVDAPLAHHSDPSLAGCRGITNCSVAIAQAFAHIDGVEALDNHEEDNILALLQRGPLTVSIDAGPYNGYSGGILNCSAEPPYHHVDHANALVGFGLQQPPVPCQQQPTNHSYATYCDTAWTGRQGGFWPEWEPFAASSLEECCSRCAGIVGEPPEEPAWNKPFCGAAVFRGGTCSMLATSADGHSLSGMPSPSPGATTCIPFSRTPAPEAPIPYWKLKNSWGPGFGEGGYARLLFGNTCLRGVARPIINSTSVPQAAERE